MVCRPLLVCQRSESSGRQLAVPPGCPFSTGKSPRPLAGRLRFVEVEVGVVGDRTKHAKGS